MAGQRSTTRLLRFTSFVAGFLTLFVLTLAIAPRAEALSRSANADPGPDTISRANLDGTGKELSLIDSPDGACGVAVDDAYIYWGTRNGVGRANLDGTGVDEEFITGTEVRTCAVAVDDAHIYWTGDTGADWTPINAGPIARANLDGSGVDPNFIPGARACAVAVDSAHIYWATSASGYGLGDPGSLARANLDGTDADPDFIAGEPYDYSGLFSCAVAVDIAHVYWGNHSNRIGRANLDGTGADPDFIAGEPYISALFGMAVDTGHIYWSDPYSAIGRAGFDGTDREPNFITGGNDPRGVAVDSQHIYWANVTNPSAFSLNVERDRKRGTATLFLGVPGPGTVRARGKWVVKKGRRATRFEAMAPYGLVELPVKAKGKKRKQLNRNGRTKLKAKVTYTPDGGEPNTQSKKIKLIKR